MDLRGDPADRTNAVLLGFFQAYIARGVNLAALTPLLKRTQQRSVEIGDRFSELRVLTLRAWQQLKLGRSRTAMDTLRQAVEVARETGYTRIVLEVPDLQPLIGGDDSDDLYLLTEQSAPTAPPIVLSPQELTVLRLLDQDYRYAQIAQELKISINTVQTHVRNIYTKLEVSRRAQALARVRELGLL